MDAFGDEETLERPPLSIAVSQSASQSQSQSASASSGDTQRHSAAQPSATPQPLSPVEMMLGVLEAAAAAADDGARASSSSADATTTSADNPHPHRRDRLDSDRDRDRDRREKRVSLVSLADSFNMFDTADRYSLRAQAHAHPHQPVKLRRSNASSLHVAASLRNAAGGPTAKQSRLSMSMSQSFSIVADAVTSIQGAYSNNWAFGVFEKWWAVDPQEFAFASAATSQATTKRTKPSRVAGLNTQQQQSNTKQQDDDESDELERNDTPILSLKMPSRTLISPPSQVHLQSLDWDHHHHQYGNGSNMPHHNAIHTTQPLRSPTISIISSNHERPTHSITPIVSTALCPCITFAQNREMFLRSGGVIENDHIERCCGHPSVDSTESGRIWQSALCFTSVMPCCLCCIPHRSLRKSIRSRYALRDLDADGEGGECGELLLSFCCMSCSLVQERREILHWDGVVGDAKKRRSVVL